MFSYENLLTLTTVINLFYLAMSMKEMDIPSDVLSRSRRQLLLWPNSTLLQFNAGVGVPSGAKNININWAFQANFQLPWNSSQIPVDILHANTGYVGTARKKRSLDTADKNGDYHDDAKLYHFYIHVEDILDGFGHNGRACVLQTLCQLGAEPLHSDDQEDVLHELASFILNPKNDAIESLTEDKIAYQYIKAYTDGEKHEDCTKLYEGCSVSFIDSFTKRHDVH